MPFDPYNFSRIDEIALGMLERYSTARIAREMAQIHSTDFLPISREALYWETVAKRIDTLALKLRRIM